MMGEKEITRADELYKAAIELRGLSATLTMVAGELESGKGMPKDLPHAIDNQAELAFSIASRIEKFI